MYLNRHYLICWLLIFPFFDVYSGIELLRTVDKVFRPSSCIFLWFAAMRLSRLLSYSVIGGSYKRDQIASIRIYI
jgi:hypothetical protein